MSDPSIGEVEAALSHLGAYQHAENRYRIFREVAEAYLRLATLIEEGVTLEVETARVWAGREIWPGRYLIIPIGEES
jgi:hypothetical protein